ncbi:growth/differentiation factor 8 [Teleopsis dalmanni]|uniref:growth/differentiation factor 8 n=1 Tax=Teleopsis dalmanni TaxID=139649 RepID=UPI0018CD1F4A|nr:growth/differentiation factor 8 [Teleopsis dalmanni]
MADQEGIYRTADRDKIIIVGNHHHQSLTIGITNLVISTIWQYRKTEIINFNFDNPSIITRAIMHVYIRGREWVRINNPSFLEKVKLRGSHKDFQEIIIIISRVTRCSDSIEFTHSTKLIESRQKIPNGMGKWVQIELKQLTAHLMEDHNRTFGIIVKGKDYWMHRFIVTYDATQHKTYSAHIELYTKDNRRIRRSTSLDCQESENEVRCCRYPLKVNFTDFGWHFVVAPTSFDAYFCNGECKVGYLEQYTHTHIASLTTSAKPCCSPTKMSPLSLLYFNFNQILMHSTIPNMSVEKCSCS